MSKVVFKDVGEGLRVGYEELFSYTDHPDEDEDFATLKIIKVHDVEEALLILDTTWVTHRPMGIGRIVLDRAVIKDVVNTLSGWLKETEKEND